MKALGASLLVFVCFSCGVEEPTERTRVVISDAPPVSVVGQGSSALVRWTLNESSCEQDALRPPQHEDYGTVTVEGDQLALGLSSMPELTGTIVDGRAEISGLTTFWTDVEITCDVNGVADMQGGNLVVAQVSEALTSEAGLDCLQDWSLEIEY